MLTEIGEPELTEDEDREVSSKEEETEKSLLSLMNVDWKLNENNEDKEEDGENKKKKMEAEKKICGKKSYKLIWKNAYWKSYRKNILQAI